jgi:predicted CopG family antitoxin
LRAFLNSILFFIGTTSLTDEEFETVTATVTIYDQVTYDNLANILKDRESVSTYVDRLTFYYRAAGVEVQPSALGTSNVFLGSVL